MNKKLLSTLENQAKKMADKNADISYDETTRLVMKNINWQTVTSFKEDLDHLYLNNSYVARLDYYYGQILKEVSMNSQVDLSSGKYIDFWIHIDRLEFGKYLLKYRDSVVNDKNLFSFLSILRVKMKEFKFVNNFKLKSLAMLSVKKGFTNG